MSVSSQNPAGLSVRDEWMAEIGLACAEVDGGGTVERGMALLESAAVKALDEYSGLLELLTSQSQRIPDDSRLIAWGRKCFLLRKLTGKGANVDAAALARSIGDAMERQGLPAIEWFQAALDILGGIHPERSHECAELLARIGWLHARGGRPYNAIATLSVALELKLDDRDDLTVTLLELIASVLEKIDRPVLVYEFLLGIRGLGRGDGEQGGGDRIEERLMKAADAIASGYSLSGEISSEIVWRKEEFKQALFLRESPLLAAMFTRLVSLYCRNGEAEKILRWMDESMGEGLVFSAIETPLTLLMLESWAECYFALGRIDNSRSCLQCAWRIRETSGGCHDLSAALALRLFAAIHLIQGKPEEAVETGRRCVQLLREVCEPFSNYLWNVASFFHETCEACADKIPPANMTRFQNWLMSEFETGIPACELGTRRAITP